MYWFRKVLKTSWLEKPSRSSARGRSSFRNEPSALQFLRSMISASMRGRASGSRCLARTPVDQLLLARLDAGDEQRPQALAHAGIGERHQPVRRLDDVRVGVVVDAALCVGDLAAGSPWLAPRSGPLGPPFPVPDCAAPVHGCRAHAGGGWLAWTKRIGHTRCRRRGGRSTRWPWISEPFRDASSSSAAPRPRSRSPPCCAARSARGPPRRSSSGSASARWCPIRRACSTCRPASPTASCRAPARR